MKKLALVLCTVMAICCAGSAFAATIDTSVTNSRNGKTTLQTENSETTKAAMPCFRAGDTLNFSVSGLSGSQLTIISYKVDKDIANETVQYIDQRTISGTTDTIKYVVRNIDQGIYRVAVKDSNSSVYNLYYKVGTPKVELVNGTDETANETTNYYVKRSEDNGETYLVGFMGKVNMGSTDVSLTDAGVKKLGFKFTANGAEQFGNLTEADIEKIDADVKAKISDYEVNGAYSVYFIQTIYGVPSNEISNITAVPTLDGAVTATETE